MSNKTAKIFNGVILAVSIIAIIFQYSLEKYSQIKGTTTYRNNINVVITLVSIFPAVVLLALAAPFEVLATFIATGELNYNTLVKDLVGQVMDQVKSQSTQKTINWSVLVLVSLSISVLSFVTSVIGEAEAACADFNNLTTCTSSTANPFYVGRDAWVWSKSVRYSAPIGGSNLVSGYWTASRGQEVGGTLVCALQNTSLDRGKVPPNMYQVTRDYGGTFISGYSPEESCSGEGWGFGAGLGFNICPTVSVTGVAVKTFVTVDCPAKRIKVSNEPVYIIIRVAVDTLKPSWLLTNMVTTTSYKLCNIKTDYCIDVPGLNGVFQAWVSNDGEATTVPTGSSKAWVTLEDATDGTVAPIMLCDSDSNCYQIPEIGSQCPGVVQNQYTSDISNPPVWDNTRSGDRQVLGRDFFQTELKDITETCSQAGAGLTATGTGNQPRYWLGEDTGTAFCQPTGAAPLPGIQPGTCTFPETETWLAECAGLPTGHYSVRYQGSSNQPGNCTWVNYTTEQCECFNSTCGDYCSCPPGGPVSLPGESTTFSDMVPMEGLCNAAVKGINATTVELVVADSNCYIAGDVVRFVESPGVYFWQPVVQGWRMIYTNTTCYYIKFNWTSTDTPTGFNWTENVTSQMPTEIPLPPPNGKVCWWDCRSEILCEICTGSKTGWCFSHINQLSYGEGCDSDFPSVKWMDVAVLRAFIYGSIAAIFLLMALALVHRLVHHKKSSKRWFKQD